MKQLECKKIIRGLPPLLLSSTDVIALDLELAGLREEQLHRPAGRMTSLAGSFDGETAYIVFGEGEVAEFMSRIEKATWVFHNSTFDLGHLRRWATIPERKNLRDTMLIEKIMFSDYYDDFGLNDLVRRYLGCYMPKDVRKEFHTLEGEMTEQQIQYAALDVIGTWLVDKEQQKILEQKDRLIWERIDLPTVWTSIDLSGFSVNIDKWNDIAERNQEIVDRIEYELGKRYQTTSIKTKYKKRAPTPPKAQYDEDGEELPILPNESEKYRNKYIEYMASAYQEEIITPFNPASPSQVLANLKGRGLDVESTGDDVLTGLLLNENLDPDAKEFVERILEYRAAAKKVSTYGKSYMKFVEPDGRIYPSLQVIGASSGRNSCRSPNLQQIPRPPDKKLHPEMAWCNYRECFIAGKGRKLVIADYSAQEPRIFASICKDEALLEIFNSGKDIYCEVARVAFNESITKEDKERRNQIKALVLGLIYGLSPYGFARDNEVSQEVAEEMFQAFFVAFPKAAQWVKEQQLRNKGFTRTILGRKCHLHPYNSQWKRNSLNNPMQGSGADMTKLAMKEFRKVNRELLQQNRVGIILPVHDEIILWCDEEIAEQMKVSLEDCMIRIAELVHVGVPAVVEAHIADTWAEK